MPKLTSALDGQALIDACHGRAVALLHRNLTPAGEPALERAAALGIETRGEHQAAGYWIRCAAPPD